MEAMDTAGGSLDPRSAAAIGPCGFKFVGSTIVYAYMQATSMVNDHLISCPVYHELRERKKS